MNREDYVLKPFKEHADYLNDRVSTGIETWRKGWCRLRLKDSQGQPLAHCPVRVAQTKHDFHFGANLFMLDEFETLEKNSQYRDTFYKYFNFATLPFYWQDLESAEGKPRFDKHSPRVYRRPAPDLCLEYCEEHQITPKAHCLHYDHFTPDWVKNRSLNEQWQLLENRFRACAERYAERIPGWEVTNESFWNNAMTQMYFAPDFMEKSYALAETYFPRNELIANEGGNSFVNPHHNRDPYFMQLERAKLKGARIDTIGLQYHVWSTPENEAEVVAKQFNPLKLYQTLDEFYETFHCPMQITEMTFPCFDPESHAAEDLQAEVLKQIYAIWFSHPAVEAAIYWNLVDGYAFGADPGDFSKGENRLAGGLMHFDLTPKPALRVLKELFTQTWHTELTAETDEAGEILFKGFYGTYTLHSTHNAALNNRQFGLHKGGEGETLVDIDIN